MTAKINTAEILREILDVEPNNKFLKYIVRRVQDDDYRGWHISQHNRYEMDDIWMIIQSIHDVAGTKKFAIPPGDYDQGEKLHKVYTDYQDIVVKVHENMGRGTINSLKKNFFPDIERMGLLSRLRGKVQINGKTKVVLHGIITGDAVDFIQTNKYTDKYRKFTECIDKLFGRKVSELAEMLNLSQYARDPISIYELMFILSDNNENIGKIKLLNSYRRLNRSKRSMVIDMLKQYACPNNFGGDKTKQRDFHNWKNQIQQIMMLLKMTMYFEVDTNKNFRLNVGDAGLFQTLTKRSQIPKREYFSFHGIEKRDNFELHHIIPLSSARNQTEAKMVDSYKNLIYIHKSIHKKISRSENAQVVLRIDKNSVQFSDFRDRRKITAINGKEALYSIEPRKIRTVCSYNADLLKSVFEFEM